MARKKAKVGTGERLLGYGILALLGVIAVWLLVQQSRFNPAVLVALRGPLLPARSQAVSGQTPAVTAAFLPEVSGFTPLAPIESFGPETLSDKIDGKAELYLTAGFKEMSCRSFSLKNGGEVRLEVFLYDMGSAPNAYAVFSGQRRSGSPSIPLTANAYATANALFFTQGRFYVEIVADRAGEGLQGSLEDFARALLARLPAVAETKGPTALFPPEGLEPETVRLCAADTFGCEGLNNIFTGEYRLKDDTATAFLAQRDTPAQARAEAQKYLDFLTANGYQKVEAARIPEGAAVLVLDNSYEMVFVLDRTLAGVHDATSLAAAQELAARLQAAIKGKP